MRAGHYCFRGKSRIGRHPQPRRTATRPQHSIDSGKPAGYIDTYVKQAATFGAAPAETNRTCVVCLNLNVHTLQDAIECIGVILTTPALVQEYVVAAGGVGKRSGLQHNYTALLWVFTGTRNKYILDFPVFRVLLHHNGSIHEISTRR